MASVNKVILIGNLGADPELKYLPSGQAVCEMRIATNEKWTDKNEQKQERTEWHRIVVWGKQGENAAKYLAKGRPVYIEGRITTRSWDDKNTGEKKYMTEIVANVVTFLGGGERNGESTGRQESQGGDAGSDEHNDHGRDETPPPDDGKDEGKDAGKKGGKRGGRKAKPADGPPAGSDDDIPF